MIKIQFNMSVKRLIKFEYDIEKLGRKNFSFGSALHDKKPILNNLGLSRILDFSFGSVL